MRELRGIYRCNLIHALILINSEVCKIFGIKKATSGDVAKGVFSLEKDHLHDP
jgi:hypothetical protein